MNNTTKTNTRWTPGEEALLIELRNDELTHKEIGMYLGRPWQSCKTKYSMLTNPYTSPTSRNYARWTDIENELICDMTTGGYSFKEIGRKLTRTPKAIENQYYRLAAQAMKAPVIKTAPKTSTSSLRGVLGRAVNAIKNAL